MDRTLIRLFAELMASTQAVPSMRGLGAGERAWDEIRRHLNLFGWNTADELEQAILKKVSNA